jgi:hypothetical protein
VAANRIAKWDGSSWSALGSGMNNAVHALAVYDDGGGPALFAGGDFGFAGSVSAPHIARWSGSNWSRIGRAGNVNGTVRALLVYDDGHGSKLYAGGLMTGRIKKWLGGYAWTRLAGAETFSRVLALAAYDDGRGPKLYAGGGGGVGVGANHIASWDGAGWSALGSGMTSLVSAFAVYDDGGGAALFAGGLFRSAIDSGDSYLAKWSGLTSTVLDFELEDDFATPLGNGQRIDSEFGRLVVISSSGANAGPATFDTTPGGPNDPALNDDMLIGHGNVLLLEDDWYAWAQSVPGFFDVVTDDPHGGDLILDFTAPVSPRSVLLIDINPPPNRGASVTLVDEAGGRRVYSIEPGWTGTYGDAGPHKLDLTTLDPQPGNGTPRLATATETPEFLQDRVVEIVVHLTGFGAIDELELCR